LANQCGSAEGAVCDADNSGAIIMKKRCAGRALISDGFAEGEK